MCARTDTHTHTPLPLPLFPHLTTEETALVSIEQSGTPATVCEYVCFLNTSHISHCDY